MTYGQDSGEVITFRSPSDVLGERIRESRRRRGWTSRQLAERCMAMGLPRLTPSVMANIESGRPDADGRRRRDITVDELLAIAYALDVPPSHLLLPGRPASGTTAVVAVTETCHIDDPTALLRWIRGDAPLPGSDARAYIAAALDHAPDAGQALADYARTLVEQQVQQTISQIQKATPTEGFANDQVNALMSRVETALTQGMPVADVLALLREARGDASTSDPPNHTDGSTR